MPLSIRFDRGPQAPETVVYKDILPEEDPDDRAFASIIQLVHSYTATAPAGAQPMYELFQSIKYLTQNRIPGDIVECGVWRGGSMMLAASALLHFGDTSRALLLYDTFAGMTEPDDVDVDFDGTDMRSLWAGATSAGNVIGFGGSAQEVKANLLQTGYPEARMNFIVGDVLQTIPANVPSQIALLRLDTDWYKSTLHELSHLYDLIVPNGVLIVDDYGWCRGARKATDEFFARQAFKPMMHRVTESVRLFIKPANFQAE